VLSLSCLSSCSIFSQKHDDSARMIGNLQGGSTPDAAKKQLKYLGFSGWGERTLNNTSVLAVRFSDLGVAGDLELKFYNDRLMVAQFDPDDPSRYMSLLTEQVGTFSSGAPAHSKQISSEVSLGSLGYTGYYGSSRTHPREGAYLRIAWVYLPVAKEWQANLAKHSSIFVSQLQHSA
jgi:hypothetical protein